MRITNNLGLPDPIVEAVKYDDYDAGSADISVTSLLSPPLQRKLRQGHSDQIVEDASDMIWALMGKAVHEVLRRADSTGIVEKRLSMEVDGKVISGQFDRLSLRSDTLEDYKSTSTWSVVFGSPDWEKQLNLYRFLLVHNGYPDPQHLRVVAFLRDWSRSKARSDANYPQHTVAIVPVKKWTMDYTEVFIQERLKAHFVNPPTCTDEDRWKKEDSFAVMKTGRKTAMRVLSTLPEAKQWMTQNGGTHVDIRKGEYTRCENYCNVSTFCPLFNGGKK